jgi:hypothetical protein
LGVDVKKIYAAYGVHKPNQTRSANSLYKSYSKFLKDKGEKPLSFGKFVYYAKEKGLLPKNYNAGAEIDNMNKVDELDATIQKNNKKIVSVILIGIGLVVLYNVFKPVNNPQPHAL